MKAPVTLGEFYRTSPTERRCWGALRRLRWPRKTGHGNQALGILPWAHTAFGNLKTWLRGASARNTSSATSMS